ncbi:M14 family zinc carboxypeptidase [Aliamphritea hakodatensis]|uniref:M14 family zinc carboxypeptidase n=1 Tax=Aliamphritea hakodatensis TaxID=2895352 RepID=UPI0022FD8E2D|nr:M14 family zinc carboxypeptidase [Aliamphritea hakodatensis]
MALTLDTSFASTPEILWRKSALRTVILGCLLINTQTANAESAITASGLTLPAQSLSEPVVSHQQEQASDVLTGSARNLLSGLNKKLTIDNSTGTHPVASVNEQMSAASSETSSEKPPATAGQVNALPAQITKTEELTKESELIRTESTAATANTLATSQLLKQPALTLKPVSTATAQPAKNGTLKGNAKKLLSQATVDAKINNAHNTPILPSMISATAPLQESISQVHKPTASQAAQREAQSLNSSTLEQATKAAPEKALTDPSLPARYQLHQEDYAPHPDVTDICTKIGNKLSSVSVKDCLDLEFISPRFYSNNGELILEKHYPASPDTETPVKILFIGGIHGDEYSSISVTFKWLKTLDENHSGAYDWHFLPLANPDGLLKKRATRVNANKVDLNRNFIPAKAAVDPIKHWQTYAKKRPRYFPGRKPLSEPESQAIHTLIDELKPDVIVSVHAPHGILDFDGSIQPPRKLGPLYLKQLGTYPGSLGNYGWFVKSIPVMTIELKHAGIMPKKAEISRMWTDLISWVKLRTNGKNSLLARRTDAAQ